MPEHIHTYSEPSLSLAYPKHRHMQKFDGFKSLSDIWQCLWKWLLQGASSQAILDAWQDSQYVSVSIGAA